MGGGWGGVVIEVLLFIGIDIYSGEGVFLIGHIEKGSSDFSRKIVNDHTIFFIINAKFGKKLKENLIKTYCNTCQMILKFF